MSATKARGRETAVDMLRTLLVVFALVLPLWFFGQSSPSDNKAIRPVDPVPAYQAFRRATHGPTPSGLPAGWTATVTDYRTAKDVLRVGYVVGDHYLEFLGSTGTDFLDDATGGGRPRGSVTVGERAWQSWENGTGEQSLVLRNGSVTVVVGGPRETATQAELVDLAELVR